MVHIFVYQWEVQDICICTCTCTCLRAQNRARKTHVFGKRTFGGHDGVGWGGLSTFLVHRTLYVATLQRSLMLLLRSMLLPLIRSVAILEQLMLHGVLSKTSSPIHRAQRAKIFSCLSNAGNGDMWIYIRASSKRPFRRWNACCERRRKSVRSKVSKSLTKRTKREFGQILAQEFGQI